MEGSDSPFISFLKGNILIVLLAFLGILFVGFGIYQFLTPQNTAVTIEKGKDTLSAKDSQASQGHIVIDVSGAVNTPGVYRLDPEGRVEDAITKAGGFHTDADTETIAKKMNLAAKLTDGMKLYVPFIGDEVGNSGGTSDAGSTSDASGLVSINTATQSQLESLPGIGAVTATKIMGARPYTSVEELTAKKVVGSSVYTKIKDLISL